MRQRVLRQADQASRNGTGYRIAPCHAKKNRDQQRQVENVEEVQPSVKCHRQIGLQQQRN